jgi:hypothetical protein
MPNGKLDTSAALSKWLLTRSYDTAADYESDRTTWVKIFEKQLSKRPTDEARLNRDNAVAGSLYSHRVSALEGKIRRAIVVQETVDFEG